MFNICVFWKRRWANFSQVCRFPILRTLIQLADIFGPCGKGGLFLVTLVKEHKAARVFSALVPHPLKQAEKTRKNSLVPH